MMNTPFLPDNAPAAGPTPGSCLVSVIIPNYNHAAYLGQRIESVLAQTWQDYELILMDDCSTDHSREILEKYRSHPRVSRVMYNEANSGSTFRQWNKGVAAARGTYVWLAESDDYAHPDFLETMVEKLQRCPSAGLAFCHSHLVDERGVRTGSTTDWHMAHEPWEALTSQACWPGELFCRQFLMGRCAIPNASAVVFRKQCYQAAGGADEARRMTGDWKLWFNLLLGTQGVLEPGHLNYFRSHSNTVRHQRSSILREETLQNLKEFYTALRRKGLHSGQMREHIFDWAFSEAIWKSKRQYSRSNLRLYLKGASADLIWYLLLIKSPVILRAHLRYRLGKKGSAGNRLHDAGA
jgi:glycosyltransferase involved in cell wall biosynthesis